jgi:cytochrome b
MSRILVWDLPTRAFHWLLASLFAVAFLTAESERWRDVHAIAGYTMLALVAFRVLWGVVGTRHARFASFGFAPRRAGVYLLELVRGRAPHHAGHNPAGAIAIYALLAATIVVALTGLAAINDVGGHALEEFHEGAANLMLALVGVHVVGVIVGSLAHRENLATAMVTGYKAGEPRDAIRRSHALVAIALVALVVALWTGALPMPGLDPAQAADVRATPQMEHHSERPTVERTPTDAHPGG